MPFVQTRIPVHLRVQRVLSCLSAFWSCVVQILADYSLASWRPMDTKLSGHTCGLMSLYGIASGASGHQTNTLQCPGGP